MQTNIKLNFMFGFIIILLLNYDFYTATKNNYNDQLYY